jgi:hypothetical protein
MIEPNLQRISTWYANRHREYYDSDLSRTYVDFCMKWIAEKGDPEMMALFINADSGEFTLETAVQNASRFFSELIPRNALGIAALKAHMSASVYAEYVEHLLPFYQKIQEFADKVNPDAADADVDKAFLETFGSIQGFIDAYVASLDDSQALAYLIDMSDEAKKLQPMLLDAHRHMIPLIHKRIFQDLESRV